MSGADQRRGKTPRRRRGPPPRGLLPWRASALELVGLGLLVLAVFYTLYFARVVLVPVVAALLLYELLYPRVRWLSRLGLPISASAALILLTLLALLVGALELLVEPAESWLHQAPASIREIRDELRATAGAGPMEELQEIGDEVEDLIEGMSESEPGVQAVRIEGPGLLGGLVGWLEVFAGGVFITFFTTFFLLAQGDKVARGIVSMGRTRATRRHISNVLRNVRDEVSVYITTVTLINIGLGAVTGLLMWFLGVPNPALWGAMVAVFNFAPYLGAAVSGVVLTVVGATTFDTLGQALLVPASFLLVNSLEGSVITPMILGHRISLSSLSVFLAVIFWGWLWGPVGALMAVPITASLNVLWRYIREVPPDGSLVPSTEPRRPPARRRARKSGPAPKRSREPRSGGA